MKLHSSMFTHDPFEMGRLESILVWLFIGIACPYLTFVAFWWSTALLHFYVFSLPDSVIAMMALTGLGLGCLLDVVFLRRWVQKFYSAGLRLMFVFYCGCFVVGFTSFMGFPLGTFVLGIFAGAYIGRRGHHRRANQSQLRTALSRTALMTSSLNTLTALPIVILGLHEPIIGSLVERYFGLDRDELGGPWGFVLVGLICLLLFAGQHVCTEIAGRLAFRISSHGAGHGP